jgi:hypothetical protein
MNFVFNVGLLGIILYMSMDVLLKGDDDVSRPEVQLAAGISLIVMLFYNFYYLFSKYRITYEWSFIRIWLAFIVLIVIYYLIAYLELPSRLAQPGNREVVIALFGLSGLFFIYHGTLVGHLTQRKLDILLLALMGNGLLEIYHAFSTVSIKVDLEVINTSAGYVFLMIMPLLMYKFRQHNIWVFFATLVLTILTGKRGALLIYVFLLFYSLINIKVLAELITVNYKTLMFALITVIIAIFAIDNAIESLKYRFVNIVDERTGEIGSGRDYLWSSLLIYWWSGDILKIFIGSGFNSTYSYIGQMAHSDFVSFIFQFGLLGLSIYLIMLNNFRMTVNRISIETPYLGYLLTMSLIILVGRGFFAGTIRTDNINLSITIGYLLAMYVLTRGFNVKN